MSTPFTVGKKHIHAEGSCSLKTMCSRSPFVIRLKSSAGHFTAHNISETQRSHLKAKILAELKPELPAYLIFSDTWTLRP